MGCSNGSCAINAPNFLPSQSVQKFDASGNICGGTSSFVPGGSGCGCGTGTSGNICGGTSSFVPSGGGCGHCSACRAEQAKQAATVPSGNICGGTSSFTPAGDSCRCSPCLSKRMRRGAGNKFPGVRRVGTDLEDPRGKMFIPTPPVSDKRRQMLPNGGGVAQIIPTRTAEPVKAQGAAVPAMIPAATKPTDLGAGPATNTVMMEGKKEDIVGGLTTTVPLTLAGQELVAWTAPDYCSDDRLAATELCRQGGDQQLSEGCRRELRAFIASGDKTPLAQWVNTRELCSGELQRLLGLVEDVKTSAGLWPVYQSSGAPMNRDREMALDREIHLMAMNRDREMALNREMRLMAMNRDREMALNREMRLMAMNRDRKMAMNREGAMAVIQPMRFANPSKPSFLPTMSVLRPSGGMYRPSGGNGVDMSFTEEEAADDDVPWNQRLLRDTSPTASGGKGDSGGKGGSDDDDDKDDDDRHRGPSTTDYIREISGAATSAFTGITRLVGQQADNRLRQLMAENANTANARMEANRTLQIELDAGIRRATAAATAAAGTAGGGARVAELQAEIRAMTEAQTRSSVLAQTNAPPSTSLAPQQDRPRREREEDKGLSTPAMVGIGVGAVAVLGLGAYLVMRKS